MQPKEETMQRGPSRQATAVASAPGGSICGRVASALSRKRRKRLQLLMLSAFLIAAFASGCGGSGEEAAAIRQAIREAADARGIHLPPAPSITIVVDRVSDARKALDDALSNISEDDRDAYKSAMCTALKTIGNGGTPDW